MRKFLVVALFSVVLFAAFAAPALGLPSQPSSKFQSAAGCGCHAGMVDTWNRSMHRQALTDPLYRAKLAEGEKATDGGLGPFCNACHGPIAVMSGELVSVDQSKLASVSAEAIACDFCHQVTGTKTPPGDTSQMVAADGVKRAQLADALSPAHKTAHSEFHKTAEFCGACHNVNHPANGLPLEATYTEWKAGPYAAQGVVCQDCHMTPGPGVNEPQPGVAAAGAPQRPEIYLMQWVGGNASFGNKYLAEQRLRSAAKLELTASELAENGSVPVTVRITNVGAGHMLPTGLTEYRQMWLQVTARDEAGKELSLQRRDFGTVLQDKDGKHPVELWDATAVFSDDRIPPKGSVEQTYAVAVPAGAVTIEAALYYRSASEEAAKKAGVEVPTTLMAADERVVYASEEARAEWNKAMARMTTASAVGPSGEWGPLLGLTVVSFLGYGGLIFWGVPKRRKGKAE